MEKEILELNEDVLCTLSKLDKSKVYLFNIELPDWPKDKVNDYLTKLKEIIDKTGIVGIYNATHGGMGYIEATELKQYLEEK